MFIIDFIRSILCKESRELQLLVTKLKTEISELLNENKNLKIKEAQLLKEQTVPGDYPIYKMRYSEQITELEELGLEMQVKTQFRPDTWVYYTDEEGWNKIIPFLTFPADLYVAEGGDEGGADCDGYAKYASAKAEMIFKLANGCIQTWGQMPLGRHAWNLVTIHTDNGRIRKQFEPNAGFEYAGELFSIGDHVYQPDSWK